VSVSPVTEDEVQVEVNILKGKFSAGYEEIPQFLVKECLQFILQLSFVISHELHEFSQIQ